MATAQFTALSAQGQIVLPKALRTQLNLPTGTRFVIFLDGENIVLKPVKVPETGDFKSLLDNAQEWAREVGMTEQDIQDAISDVRSI
jgi:antitoxin PrlF